VGRLTGAVARGEAAAALRVRPCRPADRAALLAIGHPAGVPAVMAPGPWLRLRWFLSGTCAQGFVAEEGGGVVGSVHFVRDRRDPRTWMFGHWRVAAPRRRAGVGGRLLREAARAIPGLARLYSHVDWGNDVSILAHERLGFERAPEIQGRAPLSGLAVIGPAAPPARLEPVRAAEWPALLAIYARAMGSLWMRLLPDHAPGRPPWRPGGRVFRVVTEEGIAGFLLQRAEALTFYMEPERAGAAALARLAARLLGDGHPRDRVIDLRGLTRALVARPGPIAAQVLMGMPDAARLLG
jgi:RimJ/RimL family protein N-acetyltransferase